MNEEGEEAVIHRTVLHTCFTIVCINQSHTPPSPPFAIYLSVTRTFLGNTNTLLYNLRASEPDTQDGTRTSSA